MQLGYGFQFSELYDRGALIRLDGAFASFVREINPQLHHRLMTARATPVALEAKETSQLLIDLGPLVEDFLSELFGIRAEVTALKGRMFALAPLYSCKRLFVQRKAAKAIKPQDAQLLDGDNVRRQLSLAEENTQAFELAFACAVMKWLDAPDTHAAALHAATQYAAWALYSDAGKQRHGKGILFRQPRKLDPLHLVEKATELRDGVLMLKTPHPIRPRHGFALTDDGGTTAQSLDEAHYCIFCHNQGKDSCAKGMKEPQGGFKTNAANIPLAGCPLEERISEMNFLRAEGIPLGALAMITVDNPMCAGTGHRICNDCMKSCIYQKQEPVNIPQAETRSLRDVLELPYGFEIYSLLTRWNPLNLHRPLPRPTTGRKVLVAGMGPAGYTLAHHLMNDGHSVVGIDGLKIEPLPETLCGVRTDGTRCAFTPVRDVHQLMQALDERAGMGFGGVAEYGITVRWDKNFLTLLRLLLERRGEFLLAGGVRMGGTMTIETAWELGFDHVALCMGAGKPTLIDMQGGVARGVRTASDFLMALQLTGAARNDSLANLQLRLPVVVIGGGLTAIDTATEALAYYPVQVEKFLSRYETLALEQGEGALQRMWNDEEREIAAEFLAHARALRQERRKPHPDLAGLLKQWGGVTMAYRRTLTDAPSYRLNHEEIEKALEEGIFIAQGLEPLAVEVDGWGHANALRCKHTETALAEADTQHAETTLPARTVLIAAGTSPNTVLASESASLRLHGKYFQAVDESGENVTPEKSAKPAIPHMLAAWEEDGRAVSFFGDLHPSFAGNVVKAMGSAKQGYPVISRMLARRAAPPALPDEEFFSLINTQLRATVHEVIRLTPTIVEVVVKAPLAARQFRPGQFYRLQNYEAFAPRHAGSATTLAMEGLALTGAAVDVKRGLLSMIVLEMGGSSDLCAVLNKGEPVVVMGPTGEATHIPSGKTVALVGGGLGNAVLFSIGRAARDNGCKVVYFAGYKKAIDRYKISDIEQAADTVIWCCDEALLPPGRPQDKTFQGNIVQAMLAYAQGTLGETPVRLNDADHMIVIGSDRMMEAVKHARHGVLAPHLKPGHEALGSINSPMQCMMKEICAQCLQQHIDPQTGAVSYVYSCRNQDQKLDYVSFPHLHQRLKQNSVQETLTTQWLRRCLQDAAL